MNALVYSAAAAASLGALLAAGAYAVTVLDLWVAARVAGHAPGLRAALVEPVREAARLLLQRRARTERPDAEGWALAPALLAALAAVSVVVVPVGSGVAVADLPVGIVLFGAAMALVTIAVFLHGWSPNSTLPLIGAYRFVAQALSFEIPFFLVMIATALPAESLAVGEIVRSQESGWNVLRQPLGLPVFIVGGLGVSFWGPLSLPDAEDLAGGTLAEVSGVQRLVWRAARAALLASVAAMGAALFLGGWQGPWLPGPVWMATKTFVLLTGLVGIGHLWARVPVERFVFFAWVVLMPLALLDVFLTGILLL